MIHSMVKIVVFESLYHIINIFYLNSMKYNVKYHIYIFLVFTEYIDGYLKSRYCLRYTLRSVLGTMFFVISSWYFWYFVQLCLIFTWKRFYAAAQVLPYFLVCVFKLNYFFVHISKHVYHHF